VKILYEQEVGEQKIKICKVCKAAVKHGKKSISHLAAKPVEAAPAASSEAAAAAE
jgi:hypothetical protein